MRAQVEPLGQVWGSLKFYALQATSRARAHGHGRGSRRGIKVLSLTTPINKSCVPRIS